MSWAKFATFRGEQLLPTLFQEVEVCALKTQLQKHILRTTRSKQHACVARSELYSDGLHGLTTFYISFFKYVAYSYTMAKYRTLFLGKTGSEPSSLTLDLYVGVVCLLAQLRGRWILVCDHAFGFKTTS